MLFLSDYYIICPLYVYVRSTLQGFLGDGEDWDLTKLVQPRTAPPFFLITIIRLTLQTRSVCLWTHTSSLASIFTITTRGSQKPLSLTWTMFLRLSHRPLYYTMFTASRHLGSDSDLPNTILKGDHPKTIVTKYGSSWSSSFYGEDL